MIPFFLLLTEIPQKFLILLWFFSRLLNNLFVSVEWVLPLNSHIYIHVIFFSIPPPPQFTPEGNKDNAPDGEIYDDVDHPSPLPPPPPPISTLQAKSKATKVHDDPKKQKKFEKEEKEFRKKFKYDGEIHVLYQATIASSKKGSGKDLTVQAGEIVDVISKSDPDKFICRNKEGKFGYVATSNIQQDDEVYDDIGDDCIYDNDWRSSQYLIWTSSEQLFISVPIIFVFLIAGIMCIYCMKMCICCVGLTEQSSALVPCYRRENNGF